MHAASVGHGSHARTRAAHRGPGRMHSFLDLSSNARPFAGTPSTTAFSPAQIQTAYGFNRVVPQ